MAPRPTTLPLPGIKLAPRRRMRGTTSWRARRLAVIAAQRGLCATCEAAGKPLDVVEVQRGRLVAFCRTCRRQRDQRRRR